MPRKTYIPKEGLNSATVYFICNRVVEEAQDWMEIVKKLPPDKAEAYGAGVREGFMRLHRMLVEEGCSLARIPKLEAK